MVATAATAAGAQDATRLEPSGMLFPYYIFLNYTNNIMPTNADFRSRREGRWAGD